MRLLNNKALSMPDIYIVIPAYNPSEKIMVLIDSLLQKKLFRIIVVNDGSTPIHDSIFSNLQKKDITLLTHDVNKGKGAALKTAFHHILAHPEQSCIGVVTADADLQHLDTDIEMIGKALQKNPHAMHLGVRQFDKDVPLRSRFGNRMTQFLYRLFFKKHIVDTQTGLRAIPLHLIPSFCEIQSNAYEFELEMLIRATKQQVECQQHVITTVYLDGNKGSHFNPIRDSIKIYWVLFRYTASSASSYFIDFGFFILFHHLFSNIFFSLVLARIISGSYNFMLNHHIVFKSQQKLLDNLKRYFLLSLFAILASYGLIKLFVFLGIHLYMSKIIADILIYCCNFYMQKFFIFKPSYDQIKNQS